MATREVFPRLAGDPALDLVNTVIWRLDPARREDQLHDIEDLVRWCAQVALLDPGEAEVVRAIALADPGASMRELRAVRALRESLHAVVLDGDEPRRIESEYRGAIGAARLTVGAGAAGWSLPVDLALPRRRIALAVGDLLLSGRAPVRQCADDACGWVYVDTSPRHDRRWCDSADCGNRNRVRRLRERVAH